ncbi:MAG TPA: polyprenyl synthetase family protein [Bacteroidota bacterium]|nr:polyprenyl synthetase family protein [Bacteroidota bacterium]
MSTVSSESIGRGQVAGLDFEQLYRQHKSLVDTYLLEFSKETKPRSLYQPVRYVLGGGGKRIRSVLVLLSCEAVGGNAADAMHASAAIEILHNFTLVHDDIMDHAASRRGRPTVHTKWDSNVAILVGDELLALAYRALLKTQSPRIQEIARVFTEGVVEVCEGQAYDKEFELRSRISVDDYLLMIEKKTGRMVAVATEIGALIGGAGEAEVDALKRYGELVGRAFQIQDDLLDVVGDEKQFGKTIGGDLVEGKKTYLLLEALRRAKGKDRRQLKSLSKNGGVSRKQIKDFQRIYRETGAVDAARRRIEEDITAAKDVLEILQAGRARAMLAWFADMLLHRQF